MLRRRFRRRPSLAAFVGLALAATICGRLVFTLLSSEAASHSALLVEGPCEVIAVLDGAVLVVRQSAEFGNGAKETSNVLRRVRLLGVQTEPGADTTGKPWAAAAAEFASRQIAEKSVTLQFDKRRVDRDHDWLAYVYADDGLLNERLIEAGLARFHDYPGDSAAIAKRLRSAEARAKREKVGLWSGGNL